VDRITATKIRREKEFTQLVDATWEKAIIKAGIPHQKLDETAERFLVGSSVSTRYGK
jgi:hypothetical protein